MNGWIKLHRSLLEWEWYHDLRTIKLFIHLLLKANIKDNEWQGIMIKRGSLITSRKNLAYESGLTERETRTAIARLEKTGEITVKTTNKYTLITLVNFDNFQDKEEKATSKRPANDQQTTTNKEYKKNKNNSVSVRELCGRFEVEEKQINKYIENGMKIEVIENGLIIPYNRNVLNFNHDTETAPIDDPILYGYAILNEWSEFGIETMEDVKKYNKLLKSKKGSKNE